MSRIFVVSGNHDQFRNFVRHKVAEMINEGKDVTYGHFTYVSGVDVFRGYSEVHGYFVGTFRDRPDIEDIVTHIKIVNNISYTKKLYP